MARLKILIPALAILLSGCSRIWIPEQVENRVGELVTQSVLKQMQVHNDPAWQKYIEDMGRKIASVSERPNYHYRYYIVESSAVNAFAVPDGSIFVTTGLLEHLGRDQLALAGVLAHETGHIARRHGAETLQTQLGYGALSIIIFGFGNSVAKQAGNMTSQLLGLGYGREMELEADVCSVRYLTRLGYPPDSALEFLRRILPLEKGREELSIEKYLRSHPSTEDRIKYVEGYIRQYLKSPQPKPV